MAGVPRGHAYHEGQPCLWPDHERIPPMRPFPFSSLCLLTLVAAAPAADEAIFEPGARLKVEAGAGAGGEGPAWHPELGLLSSGNSHIYQLDRDGKSHVWRKNAGTNGL